jgi:2-haloacid dehalogenase
VFGTTVDWRTPIVREGTALGRAHGLNVDWGAFADAWRRLYRPTLDRVIRGELPWAPFDALQRLMLDQVLEQFGIANLSEEEKTKFGSVWARLDPWPDSRTGLDRLRTRYIVAPLSNGSVRQLVELSRHGRLAWDAVFSVELFRAYKPDPRVYNGAVELLQAPAEAVMMVAAHVDDLRAARAQGMRTAFVRRPMEWGPSGKPEPFDHGEFDRVADDFEDLAGQLGC